VPAIINRAVEQRFQKEQKQAGLNRYIGTFNTVAILTTRIEKLLQLPGLTALVVQDVDTLTAS